MSESHEKDAAPEPTPQSAGQPDAIKTPLDNLKGILAEVDGAAPGKKDAGSQPPEASQGVVAVSSPMISKEAIRKALAEAQGLPDEKLSPRQVDNVLRPLIEVIWAAEMRKGLDKGAETTVKMAALRDVLAQIKEGA